LGWPARPVSRVRRQYRPMHIDIVIVGKFLALVLGGALLIGTAPYLLGRIPALMTRAISSWRRLHLTVGTAYIIAAVIFVLDAYALGALSSLPFRKPRPPFAEPEEESSLLQVVLTLVGIVIGLGVTALVVQESPASLKKYLVILTVASSTLPALTTFLIMIVAIENNG